MSKETSETVATVAGRVLSRGNPLDDPTFVGALIEALALSDSGADAMQACRTAFQPYMKDMLSLAGSALSQREDDPGIMVHMPVDWEKVANAIVGVVEGGSGYWMNGFHCANDDTSKALRSSARLRDDVWYAEAAFWSGGGRAKVNYDNPQTGPSKVEREIGAPEILLGLQSMALKSPRHFADLINENDDATTHDVMIQHVLFGEVVYG